MVSERWISELVVLCLGNPWEQLRHNLSAAAAARQFARHQETRTQGRKDAMIGQTWATSNVPQDNNTLTHLVFLQGRRQDRRRVRPRRRRDIALGPRPPRRQQLVRRFPPHTNDDAKNNTTTDELSASMIGATCEMNHVRPRTSNTGNSPSEMGLATD